ncbi:MAG: hypothetical protein MJZ37_00640 [Bacilli bacterium]|nr:hypothetical protein [Bacilli bacterium]
MPEGTEEILEIQYIVEDGTCVPNANSYITLEDANQYFTNKNRADWLALSDVEKQANLIIGTQYVDALFIWKGVRMYETQSLAFPRVGKGRNDWLYDLDGFPVKGIPKCLKDAICEAAYYGFKQDSELFTTLNTNGAVKRQRIEGAVEIEYFANSSTDQNELDYISKYAALNSLLRGLYIDKESLKDVNHKACWLP